MTHDPTDTAAPIAADHSSALRGQRVLHIADFAAPYPGAFIRQLRMLDTQMQSMGALPTAFAFPASAASAAWLEALRDNHHSVTLLPMPVARGTRAMRAAIEQVIEDTGATIVHTHFGSYDIATAQAVRRLRSRGKQLVQVWHYRTALTLPVSRRSLRRRLKDVLKFQLAGRGVDRCVAVTDALAEEVAARGMRTKARGIVAGTDTEVFCAASDADRAMLRDRLGVAPHQILVLHMGWDWLRKGGDILAAAAQKVHAEGGAECVYFSIGANVADLEAPVQRLEPTDAVHELHQAADIFVSASRSEGFGNGLVEALACERVAVAALVAGQQEIFSGLGDGCIAVAPEDPDALALGIRTLVERREDWPALGRANRAYIVERNSMRRWARQMADEYVDLLPQGSPDSNR